jgi:hypothetical protein
MVTEECGEFLYMDVETRNKLRLDVARVKISCPLLGTIDRVLTVSVEGVSTVIRVLEERGCIFEEDRFVQDDQVCWSEAVSPCKSFANGPVVAVVEESVMGDSDSDGSVVGQGEVQATKRLEGDLHLVNNGVEKSFAVSESRRDILSSPGVDRVDEVDVTMKVAEGSEKVRGLTSGVEGNRSASPEKVQVRKGPTEKRQVADVDKADRVDLGDGPVQTRGNLEGEDGGCPSGPILEVIQNDVGPQVIGSNGITGGLELGGNGGSAEANKLISMSENLVSFLKANEAHQAQLEIERPGGVDSLPDIQIEVDGNGVVTKQHESTKLRKPLVRFQSLPMMGGGPKCLRFAAAVQASHKKSKARKSSSMEEGVLWSAGKLAGGFKSTSLEVVGVEGADAVDEISSSSAESVNVQRSVTFDDPQAGGNWLLDEESINDVDGFAIGKNRTEGMAAEASLIIEIQQHLGLTYATGETASQARLIEMEVRDQKKMMIVEEATNAQ